MGLFTNTILAEYCKNLVKIDANNQFKIVLGNRFIRDLIIYLNTDDQLGKDRVDSLGRHLGIYTHTTEFLSDGKKKAGEFYTLNDTGAFWESWRVDVKDFLIEIDANPVKFDVNLFDEYGIDVLGLTEENLEKLIDVAKESFIKHYRKLLFVN